jgi:hypothetical protein
MQAQRGNRDGGSTAGTSPGRFVSRRASGSGEVSSCEVGSCRSPVTRMRRPRWPASSHSTRSAIARPLPPRSHPVPGCPGAANHHDPVMTPYLPLAAHGPKLAFGTSRASVSGQSCGQAVQVLSLSGAMRFLQLTGTVEPPLPDDRTTAWMISMVCRASENDGRWVAAGQLAWRSGRGGPGPGRRCR